MTYWLMVCCPSEGVPCGFIHDNEYDARTDANNECVAAHIVKPLSEFEFLETINSRMLVFHQGEERGLFLRDHALAEYKYKCYRLALADLTYEKSEEEDATH